MAVISTIIAALLLTPFTMAAPAYTHTATEIDWVTVEETVTVWLDPASATSAPVVVAETTTSVATTTTTPVVVAEATYTTPSSVQTTAAATTSVVVSSYAVAASSSASPIASSSSPAAAAAASPVSASSITASNSADCEGKGAACVGDVTHWDGGLGACGWNVDTNSDLEIALPYEFMGTLSNTNPYCGRSVTLYNPTSGTTVQATVGDKCMGCVDRAIDCTDALFTAITDGTGDGRVSGIEWWLN